MNRLSLGFAALMTATVAMPLQAADLSVKARATLDRVKTSDLDLSSAEDMATLQSRLDKAKQQVCRRDRNGEVVSASEERSCVADLDQELTVQLVAETASGNESQG